MADESADESTESRESRRLQLSFNRRLALGFFAGLLLFGINMFIAFNSVQRLIDNNQRVTQHYDVLAALRSIILAVQEVESLQRGYIITGEGKGLQSYYLAASGVGQYLTTLKNLTVDEPLKPLIPVLETHIARRLAVGHQALELRRDGDFDGAQALIVSGQGSSEMEQIRRLIAQMIAHETDLLVRFINESQTSAWYALSTLIVATLANVVLLGLVYRMILSDITRRRMVERDLQAARDAAEAANQAKSMFLANMSHELRTPLNAILGYAELLQEETAEREIVGLDGDLEIIHGEGRRLLELISDILDLSKIEAGKMDLVIESFELEPLLTELGQTVATQMNKQGNAFQIKVDEHLGSMRSDQAKLRQCLLNLLSNAAKFTHQGSVTLQVSRELRATDSQDWLLFQVADTGIGIAPEHQRRLFEPFTQADSSTTRKYGGTGLGLALTRRFCEMMGGTVSVRSTLGQGSVFMLSLPAEWQVTRASVRATNRLDQTDTSPFERAGT